MLERWCVEMTKLNSELINTIVDGVINAVDDDKTKADKKEKQERGEMK